MRRNIFSNINRENFRAIRRNNTTRLWFFLGITVSFLLVLFLSVDLGPKVEGEFFFSSDDPQFQYEKMIAKVFPSQQSQIVLSAKGDVRSDEYKESVRILTDVLDVIPEVSSVKSLTSGPKNFYDATKSPLWARIILSDDGESSNLIVIFKKDSPPEDVIPKVENAMSLLESPKFQLSIAGVPYVVESIRRSLLNDLKFFSTAAFIIFGLVILLIFRSSKILLGTIISCVNSCVFL